MFVWRVGFHEGKPYRGSFSCVMREHVPYLAFLGSKLLSGTCHTAGKDQIAISARKHQQPGISRTPSGWRFLISD